MQTVESIRLLLTIALFVIGLSHLFQGKVWASFFEYLSSKRYIGVFINAFIHFAPGSLVVSFHPVYQGPFLWLTLLGWAWVIKGAVYFVFPAVGLKQMQKGTQKQRGTWAAAGIIMIAAAVILQSMRFFVTH
ncbi:hypothetical protein EYS14_06765 [Alteromonadaceae bacterium M269]|nr:hypothetical protein EYS14_06765 [Alteromonadaceae bacterium M269]